MFTVVSGGEDSLVGEPGELFGKTFTLELRYPDEDCETALPISRYHAFNAPDVIEIHDHAITKLSAGWRRKCQSARRYIEYLTGIFILVG